jgi:hypothetical protein
MPELSGHVATVNAQQGDRVLISVPMVGFPQGFQLRQGDRVSVVQSGNGAVAVPLVRSFEATPEQSDALSGTARGGSALAVSDATIQSGSGDRVVVFTLEREGSSSPQVLSVRRED